MLNEKSQTPTPKSTCRMISCIQIFRKCKLIFSDRKQINGWIIKGHKKTLGDDANVRSHCSIASHMSKLIKLDSKYIQVI